MQRINYGIDPGERSLAVAAVRTTDRDVPLKVEALSLVLHDGGVAEEKTTTSRLAVRGTKRRGRRRFRRRRTRRHSLEQALAKHSFPAHADPPTAHKVSEHFGDLATHSGFPYLARAALLSPIPDEQLARHLFAVSVRHIDRHRGWRNPWTRYHSMVDAVRNGLPDTKGAKTIKAASGLHMTVEGKLWNEAVALALATREPRTLGECAALAIAHGSGVKPTDHARRLAMGDGKESLDNTNSRIKKARTAEDLQMLAKRFALPVRPTQHDLLYELMLCAEIQGFDDITPIGESLFFQERPGFSPEVVGPCAIYEGNTRPLQKRAPEFLPSVQEFVVRQFVANLRVQNGATSHRLSQTEADLLSTHLLKLTDRKEASIRGLETALRSESGEKVRIKRGRDAQATDDEEAVYAGKPPIDRTNEQICKMERQAPSFHRWWKAATRGERELLLSVYDGVTRTSEAEAFADQLVADGILDVDELETLVDKLPDGRSAYSQRAIDEMLPLLQEGKDLFEARQRAFDLPNDWAPPGAQWHNARMNHPVLQVARSQTAPILNAFDREVGLPAAVRIEVSRQALRLRMPHFKVDNQQKERQARNVAARENAAGLGLKGREATRKLRIIGDQNQQCAYQLACGGGDLDPIKTEIDHIVPASAGANNSRSNLVAVCDACNQVKGDRPFAIVATDAQLEATISRLKSWNFKIFDKRLDAEMLRRLKTTKPEELDERSISTTAQLATELRGMIRDRYSLRGVDIASESVMAALVGEARYSAGLNEALEGSRVDGRFKSRLDYRNHLVDAVVTACVNQKVVPILEQRASLREFARLNKGSRRETELKVCANETVGKGDYFSEWLAGLKLLGEQLTELFARDQDPNEFAAGRNGNPGPLDMDAVVPRRPLRLKAYGGPLHEETAHSLGSKRVGDQWTKDELARIADEQVSVAMVALASKSRNKLSADPGRAIKIGQSHHLGADEPISLLHTASAILARGASFLAGEIHHVRVYVVETNKGRDLAFVPIYAYDIAQALADARAEPQTGDRRATSLQLRPECASFRSSISAGASAVRAALVAGDRFMQVGWIAPGDELWIDDPSVVKAVPAAAMPVEWRDQRRWFCTGSEKKTLNVRPASVSSDLGRDDAGNIRVAPTKCRISWSGLRNSAVVRRDHLSRPVTVRRFTDLLE